MNSPAPTQWAIASDHVTLDEGEYDDYQPTREKAIARGAELYGKPFWIQPMKDDGQEHTVLVPCGSSEYVVDPALYTRKKSVKTEDEVGFLIDTADQMGIACSTVKDGHVLIFTKKHLLTILKAMEDQGSEKSIVFVKRPDFAS